VNGGGRGLGKGGAIFYYGGTLQWTGVSTFTGNASTDATSVPTDTADIFGSTINGAPATITLTNALLAFPGLATTVANAAAWLHHHIRTRTEQ
jgi:hypothetical protein